MNEEREERDLRGHKAIPVVFVLPETRFDPKVIGGVTNFEASEAAESVDGGWGRPRLCLFQDLEMVPLRKWMKRLIRWLRWGVVSGSVNLAYLRNARGRHACPLAIRAKREAVNRGQIPCIDRGDFRIVNCSGLTLQVAVPVHFRRATLESGTVNSKQFGELWEKSENPRWTVVLLPVGEHWGFVHGIDEQALPAETGPSRADQFIHAALDHGAEPDSLFTFVPLGNFDEPGDGGDDDPNSDPSPDPAERIGA